ncbi:MAG: Polysaccharide deacetylase family protein [Gammaproteobacteria bacterium]|nr:Polysaccharide deacetylase family protein [Gammaproteobacteria bacterium]
MRTIFTTHTLTPTLSTPVPDFVLPPPSLESSRRETTARMQSVENVGNRFSREVIHTPLPALGSISLIACFIIILIFLLPRPAAADQPTPTPEISIIIDDIGYRMHDDMRAIAIPGALAYAIMPHSPHALKMSHLASQNGKLVLLHLPMEAIMQEKNRFLGPGALWLGMTREQFMLTLNIDLNSLPEAVGVNNHEGSLLTRHPGHMAWLMDGLKQNQKFFIDSLTSEQSVAGRIAMEKSVPYLKRDVFLDNEQNQAYIESQFMELVRVARTNGKAIGIGHPHPETIQVLSRELQELDRYGVVLVSLIDLMQPGTETDVLPVRLAK